MRSRRLVVLVGVGVLCSTFAGCDHFQKQKKAPEAAPSKDNFERKRICMEVGERVDQKERKDASPGSIFLIPAYGYNDSLKTCLYAGEVLSPKEHYAAYWVRDCFTNSVVVECTMVNGRVVSGVPLGEFNRMKACLMAEREK